jgi:pimeloyl-ACP methyl ester carboxylesterase
MVALVMLPSLVLTACSPGSGDKPAVDSTPLPAGPTSTPPAGLQRFYSQKLRWEGCEGGDRCTKLTVPLDYAHPDGEAISLAVLKVPATRRAGRIGALVVNPGGPGASGTEFASQASGVFSDTVREAFDIVGLDPRGVGKSAAVDCLSTAQLDRFVAADPDPDTAAEVVANRLLGRQFAHGCAARTGRLLAHVSTAEAAKDIDILRAALGQGRLTYYGASYGTLLGATYADLFPNRVGRMVLDGALDPSQGLVSTLLVQAHGFEVALRSYVEHCVDAGGCYLGGSVPVALDRIRQFLRDVDARPLPAGDGRVLAEGNAVYGIWVSLYSRTLWSSLDLTLREALGGDGSGLLMLSDIYTHRGSSDYTDNLLEAFPAVSCLDDDQTVPLSAVPSYFPRFEHASPTFGRIFAYSLTTCDQWPVHTGAVPHPLHAKGSAPIMVVGTTRDPATPLLWAKALARQLDNAVLVTRDGDGHTGYRSGNSCVDRAVDGYLVAGTVPEGTLSC